MVTRLALHGAGLKTDWPWWLGAAEVRRVSGDVAERSAAVVLVRDGCFFSLQFVAENYTICLSGDVVLRTRLSTGCRTTLTVGL